MTESFTLVDERAMLSKPLQLGAYPCDNFRHMDVRYWPILLKKSIFQEIQEWVGFHVRTCLHSVPWFMP